MGRIQFSESLPGHADAIYHLLDKAGLEGMVSKRSDSKYRSGPTTNWLKPSAPQSASSSCLASSVSGQADIRAHDPNLARGNTCVCQL